MLSLITGLGGEIMTHIKFREQLIKDFSLLAYKLNITVSGIVRGRPSAAATQLSRYEVKQTFNAWAC
jgi:hypothetical protein